jgi:hypothetical protein
MMTKIALVLVVFGLFAVLASLGIRMIVRAFERPQLAARLAAERQQRGFMRFLGMVRNRLDGRDD